LGVDNQNYKSKFRLRVFGLYFWTLKRKSPFLRS
jgi:hypothetical protein